MIASKAQSKFSTIFLVSGGALKEFCFPPTPSIQTRKFFEGCKAAPITSWTLFGVDSCQNKVLVNNNNQFKLEAPQIVNCKKFLPSKANE